MKHHVVDNITELKTVKQLLIRFKSEALCKIGQIIVLAARFIKIQVVFITERRANIAQDVEQNLTGMLDYKRVPILFDRAAGG